MADKKRLIEADHLFNFLRDQKVKETGAFTKGLNKGLNIALSALRNSEITPTVDVGDAIEKQKPQKPIYVDTRFRNHGKHISDGVSLSKCYKCPNCNSHIFHVFDSEKYCDRCGQALDWGTDDG